MPRAHGPRGQIGGCLVNANDVGYGTAWLRGAGKEVSENGSRVAELVNWWQRGIYHIQGPVTRADWSGEYVTFCVSGHLATFDDSDLTRLVVGAHDAAIRVSVEGAANGYIRLMFSPRRRQGNHGFYDSHPTMVGRLIGWTDRLPMYADPATVEAVS